MADLKTKPTDQHVERFIDAIDDPQQQEDSRTLVELMCRATNEEPKMWGDSIVGFGDYHYKYESGREGDWFLAGFSPRKGKFSIYVMAGFDEYEELMSALGKHKTGKSCLDVKRLQDVDLSVLEELVSRSARHVAARHAAS